MPTTTVEAIAPFTDYERSVIKLACESFPIFLMLVYPKSFERQRFLMADNLYHRFTLGAVHMTWAALLQAHTRVDILAPRLHLKSTVVNHGYSMWRLFKAVADTEGIVISYNENLAGKHTEKIKHAIKTNPYCRYWKDNKSTSESMVDFTMSFGPDDPEPPRHGAVDPAGILAGVRGTHPDFVICDDILGDFANPLEPKQLNHIGEVFNQSIASLPPSDGALVVIGTPQSYEDILYTLRDNPAYVWGRFTAETVHRDKTVTTLWPEMFDALRLKLKRLEVKERAYQVEYLLKPLLAVDTFLPRTVVEANVNPDLQPVDPFQPFQPSSLIRGVYGGMDIGKNVHPTHISIGALTHDGTLVQLYEQFLDGLSYDVQASLINQIIANFGVRRFYYDNTRGEMEDRRLSKKAIGMTFTKKSKVSMALSLESRMFASQDEPGIVLLNDKRQTNQILSVDRTLKGIETSEGHGDSFFSIALMCQAADDGPVMDTIGDAQTLFGRGGYRTTPLAGAG